MNILITGSSKGIGAEIAKIIAKEGNHKIILVSRNRVLLEELSFTISSQNKECECILFPADLSSREEIIDVSKSISREFSCLDILINNAGYLVNKPFLDSSDDEVDKMMMVNYMAPGYLIKGLIPLLKNAKQPHVVNIGSMGGFQGSAKFPGLSWYSSSKAALAVLTECLAEEYKGEGIHFNCLALGSADTEMLREAFPGYTPPLSARDMAGFIAEFALTGYKYFNGKIIPVSLATP